MKNKNFDCVIGLSNKDEYTAILIAPLYSFMRVGDIVKTDDDEFTVVYVDYNHSIDDPLMTGLFVALGIRPKKIMKKIEEVVMKWSEDDDVDG